MCSFVWKTVTSRGPFKQNSVVHPQARSRSAEVGLNAVRLTRGGLQTSACKADARACDRPPAGAAGLLAGEPRRRDRAMTKAASVELADALRLSEAARAEPAAELLASACTGLPTDDARLAWEAGDRPPHRCH